MDILRWRKVLVPLRLRWDEGSSSISIFRTRIGSVEILLREDDLKDAIPLEDIFGNLIPAPGDLVLVRGKKYVIIGISSNDDDMRYMCLFVDEFYGGYFERPEKMKVLGRNGELIEEVKVQSVAESGKMGGESKEEVIRRFEEVLKILKGL